ncbi:MAG: DUF2214 domain-containing protein [Alphaproteobacteria bacterium]|nr:DUF2214 domain-containing protein [Alphaproteobacteria bacterium]
MEALTAALEASPLAETLRGGRWSYAAVNAAHILGLALLVGAIVPLDLRLLGVWRSVPVETLARVLTPVAAAGLALAATTGLMLLSVRAGAYLSHPLVQAKLALVLFGAGSALALHRRWGLALSGVASAQLRRRALLSLACWVGALVCGRMIGFVDL